MTPKGWIVLAFLVAAAVLFLIVGFDVFTWNGHDLLAIGLASFMVAVGFHIFMHGSEYNA